MKRNVDFVTTKMLPHIDLVESARACQAHCSAEPRCHAWTWGEAPHIPTLTHVCFLKRLEEGESVTEASKDGVISGLSCRRASEAQPAATGEQAADSDRPACSALDGVDFATLASFPPVPGITSSERCRAGCRAVPGCHAWSWGKARDSPGLTDHCFMKKLSAGEQPRQIPKSGVVSGFAACPPPSLVVLPQRPEGPGMFSSADPQQPAGPGMLYCFTLSLAFGREVELLDLQRQRRAGIFACDGFAVYSNESFGSVSGLRARTVNASLHCGAGGEAAGPLNRGIFREVWKQVLSEGLFWLYDWTVKVDPDTVFFPSRLRPMLQGYAGALEQHQHGLYLNNCRFGLRGAIEVFSSAAVQALGDGWQHCEEHFRGLCSGDCGWGEDLFADQCLSEVLSVRREYRAGLLMDERCQPPAGWRSCQQEVVAFHPMATTQSLADCLGSTWQGGGAVVFK